MQGSDKDEEESVKEVKKNTSPKQNTGPKVSRETKAVFPSREQTENITLSPRTQRRNRTPPPANPPSPMFRKSRVKDELAVGNLRKDDLSGIGGRRHRRTQSAPISSHNLHQLSELREADEEEEEEENGDLRPMLRSRSDMSTSLPSLNSIEPTARNLWPSRSPPSRRHNDGRSSELAKRREPSMRAPYLRLSPSKVRTPSPLARSVSN
eukprot:m.340637 g.340637  ORF g.340637 m.340637 type:complete len:209 (+) comp19433_c0_seq1:398-1024(+)